LCILSVSATVRSEDTSYYYYYYYYYYSTSRHEIRGLEKIGLPPTTGYKQSVGVVL
jgi:hypothetical protein